MNSDKRGYCQRSGKHKVKTEVELFPITENGFDLKVCSDCLKEKKNKWCELLFIGG